MKRTDKNKIDVSQAFLVFMAMMGEVDRVAAALDLEPEQVRTLAESEGWTEKIKRVSLMSKSGKPGDYERAVNRALSFCQAQCLRNQVNRLLAEVQAMTNEELLARACVRTKTGDLQLSAKFFVDMANAAEACHRMAYNALGDTVTERCADEGGGNKAGGGGDMHSAIISYLSNPEVKPEQVTQKLIAEANDEARRLASVELPADITESEQSAE